MDAEEKEICDFLKSFLGQYVSGREICRRAGGKWRFREDQNWAVPILLRMVERGYLESDASGHFRLALEQKEKDKKKRWLSEEVRKILERGASTGDGGKVTEIEDPDDSNPK
jgi:hypothetical protein